LLTAHFGTPLTHFLLLPLLPDCDGDIMLL